MDRNTIEKAAKEYASRRSNGFKPETGLEEEIFNAFLQASIKPFVDGAHWRINAVWHEAKKECPQAYTPVLVENDFKGYSVNMLGQEEKCPKKWIRWAYIDDLLPDGKEETK